MILEGHDEVLDYKPWIFPVKSAGLFTHVQKWSVGLTEFVLWHKYTESARALKQSVQKQKVCNSKWLLLWTMNCCMKQTVCCVLEKVMPLTLAPTLPTLPPPEQLATILGSLICCDLSSQNICLKKDQIFIAHLCILLKGEMGLVMVDKCQSTCEERKGREREGGGEFFNMQYLYFFCSYCLHFFAQHLDVENPGRFHVMAIAVGSRTRLLTQPCHWLLLVCTLLSFRNDLAMLFRSKKTLN